MSLYEPFCQTSSFVYFKTICNFLYSLTPIGKKINTKKKRKSFRNKKFSILARGRSSFHLSALEATFIKSLNPLLCKQKEFVYSLKIF